VDKKIDVLETKAIKTISFISEENRKVFSQVLTMARAGWQTTQAIVEASGGTISTMFASMISMAFASIAILTPLLSAKAAAGDWISAIIGFGEIGATLVAMGAAMGEKAEAEAAARDAMSILNNIGSFLGSMNFLF